MQVRLKIVYLTQIRASPHLLTVRKQLLAETSSVSSQEDSVQKEAVAWPWPGCSNFCKQKLTLNNYFCEQKLTQNNNFCAQKVY